MPICPAHHGERALQTAGSVPRAWPRVEPLRWPAAASHLPTQGQLGHEACRGGGPARRDPHTVGMAATARPRELVCLSICWPFPGLNTSREPRSLRERKGPSAQPPPGSAGWDCHTRSPGLSFLVGDVG